jgi:hypothetical protein
MITRPKVPKEIERKVLIEAGHRCAIPTCKFPRVEIAHIIPWSESYDNSFENLIALCPNCHNLYDKDKKIDRKSMQIYKHNLCLLGSRYGEFERRVLGLFCGDSTKNSIRLPGLVELQIHWLLKDGLLVKNGKDSGILSAGTPTWEEYQLTDQGKTFVENLKQARLLE